MNRSRPNLQAPQKGRGVGFCRKEAFTLLELLVIVVIIGVLAALLLPALNKARTLAQRTACMSNLRQIGLAWTLYYEDSSGRLAESYPGGTAPNPYAWVYGNMTNSSEAGSLTLLNRGRFFPYLTTPTVYHCPADQGVLIGDKRTPTVRSYSMNAFLGDRSRFGAPVNQAISKNYPAFYSRESDLDAPSQVWVLIEEDSRTISDGYFLLDPELKKAPTRLPSTSPDRHDYAFGLNFADGHSEVWRFYDPASAKLSSYGSSSAIDSKDFQRLANVTAQPWQ